MICEPKFGKSFGTGGLELARWADLVGRVARHHLVDRGRVVEQPVGRVAHRPDERELVGDLRELGQDLGHLDAGHLGGDWLEHASDIVGDVFLGVPEVEMAGPALQVEHDDAFGLTPAGATACVSGPRRLPPEARASMPRPEAEQARPADAEDISPRHAQLRIAQIFPRLSGYDDHRVAPKRVGRLKSGRWVPQPQGLSEFSNNYCIVPEGFCRP